MEYELSSTKINNIEMLMSQGMLMQHNIVVAFTTRNYGTSTDSYRSLNLALHVGDSPESVISNRKSVAKALGFTIQDMVCAEQVHGAIVECVDNNHRGFGAYQYASAIQGADALTTSDKSVALALFFADCVPVILVDPCKTAIAVIHAGWRGVFHNIIGIAGSKFIDNFSSLPQDIIAFIGPSIGSCCFEVDDALVSRFKSQFAMSESWLKSRKIDLKYLVMQQLIDMQISPENIILEKACTACNTGHFFSYRAEHGQTGRHAAIAIITETS